MTLLPLGCALLPVEHNSSLRHRSLGHRWKRTGPGRFDTIDGARMGRRGCPCTATRANEKQIKEEHETR